MIDRRWRMARDRRGVARGIVIGVVGVWALAGVCLVVWLVSRGEGNGAGGGTGATSSATDANTSGGSPSGTTRSNGAPRKLTLAELPETRETGLHLDGGHLQLEIPQGWYVPPRSKEYLYRAQLEKGRNYPYISILHDKPDVAAMPDDLNADTIGPFVKALQASVQTNVKSAALAQEVQPVQIDDVHLADYVVQARTGLGAQIDILNVVRIEKGRAYIIELRADRGSLDKYRPFAYALAARMKIS